jgi:SAM-dependent methyltransferase
VDWSAGDAYEPYVGRWSRLVARDFVTWLGLPAGGRFLDVGSGTGALTSTLVSMLPGSEVTGLDPSPQYVGYAKAQYPEASFTVGTASGLPFGDEHFDAAVSGLVLKFVPDAGRMLSEMRRIVREDGTVAVYVWDNAGEMQMLRRFWDAAVRADPAAREQDEASRFDRDNADGLRDLFAGAGLRAVQVRSIDVPTVFSDFDDFWRPFLGGQGSAPGYAMSLSEEKRGRLKAEVRRSLPVRADGSIHLLARAWAARGER